jgi:hypothetical protein
MIDIENHSHSHPPPVPTGFLDDSGYYTSPIPTLIPSTPPTNTSTPAGTVNITKRTRKRKQNQQQHQQHDDIMSSSDHFLTLSPSSSNMGMFFRSNCF